MGVKAEIERLIDWCGGEQVDCASKMKVSQPTVSNWLSGEHGVSAEKAIEIEALTGGEFKAVNLCPRLSKLSSAA